MQFSLAVRDEHDAPLLRQHDDRLAQRAARCQDRQRIHEHDLFDSRHEATADGAAGMQPREVLAAEALVLQQRDGERVTQRKRRGRARGRCEVVRARFLAHPRVQRNVAQLRQRRADLARDGDGAYTEALEMFEQPKELIRLA